MNLVNFGCYLGGLAIGLAVGSAVAWSAAILKARRERARVVRYIYKTRGVAATILHAIATTVYGKKAFEEDAQ